jgi:glucose/arabinose dehydrogenase
VAFREGALYVAEPHRILRFDDIESRLGDPSEPVVVSDRLPRQRHHGWKFIAFGPDGWLYVPVGAPCNVCEPPGPLQETITRMKPDGSGLEIFAHGVRNSVGFDWHPDDKTLWFTDNGRDWLGDDVAALGMRFYTGTMFPPEYRHQIFVAEHGSWNRSTPIGYRLTLVRLQGDRAVKYETFAEGWLRAGRPWGRPVDVLVMPDGALLVSDDHAGAIYRITYPR